MVPSSMTGGSILKSVIFNFLEKDNCKSPLGSFFPVAESGTVWVFPVIVNLPGASRVTIFEAFIFTTAYDEYAIKAFKVNSIDYLLKPIGEDDLRQSLEKYRKLAVETPTANLEALIKTLAQPPKTYQERFMVQRGERLMSVLTDQVAYFEGEDRYVYLVKKDGARYIVQYRLSDLETLLDPKQFFRLNRSFIAHFDAISAMINLSKSRIKVELTPKAKREVIVSSELSQGLKKWLNQ